jgi:hypothetical protein
VGLHRCAGLLGRKVFEVCVEDESNKVFCVICLWLSIAARCRRHEKTDLVSAARYMTRVTFGDRSPNRLRPSDELTFGAKLEVKMRQSAFPTRSAPVHEQQLPCVVAMLARLWSNGRHLPSESKGVMLHVCRCIPTNCRSPLRQ